MHREHMTGWMTVLAAALATFSSCAGPTGPSGSPCTVRDQGDGKALVQCPDGSEVTLTTGSNGKDGKDGVSCSVQANADAGAKTVVCSDGTSFTVSDGKNGQPGQNGAPGQPADAKAQVTRFHGIDAIVAEAATVSQKFYAQATITSATADEAGVVTVNFEVKNGAAAVTNVSAVSATIAKLVPAGGGLSSNSWVDYINSVQVVSGDGGWPAASGTWAIQGSRESNGTLTNNGAGSYTYVFKTVLTQAAYPDGGAVISYERNRTHRVTVMMGGRTGATASATFDFVPDGSAISEKRDIVQSQACRSCHGPYFAAHGGDRMSLENCVTCHEASGSDPQSGNTLDFKVMIHKIHSGGELKSIPGPDGVLWDNPNTVSDETADNGEYAIWGYGNVKHTWWKAEFPAVIENCTKCHAGDGAQVNNWKTNPSRAACGSCHDDINFAAGTNHPGGQQLTDNACAVCHPASGVVSSFVAPIEQSHDWVAHDARNQPEFNVSLSVSAPGNGEYFVAGEKPKVTFALTQVDGGAITHTALSTGSAVGCGGALADGGWDGTCTTAEDGLLATANFFVHGPRAQQNPVLTTTARAEVISLADAGTSWTIASGGLVLKVDNGEDVRTVLANGQDKILASNITVNVPTGGFSGADQTALMNWLNGNANFKARAIAYLDEKTGRLAIRSRNLGKFFSVQLLASTVTAAVFNNNTAIQAVGGFTASNNIVTDVKSVKFSDRIEYELDAVDDLKPGTYVVQAEIGDRGRVSGAIYKTPSVKWVTFQVKQAAVEKPIANSCNSCHQASNGKGFVLDYPRHNKLFGTDAIDQCSGCHDYQVQSGVGGWSGAGAITRRVHAVHRGAHLNYPLVTVGYSNGDPVVGRNWNIEFPQDIRNCQACHPDGTTSGTWKVNATRLACGGCHDSDSAVAHLSAMTADPTPLDPYSGDEQESCRTCHAVR